MGDDLERPAGVGIGAGLWYGRWVTVLAVVFAAIGSVLMLVAGAVSTVNAIGVYVGLEDKEAFSDKAALKATVELVSSLDQFLFGLVLLIFAYGVFRLFIVVVDDPETPDWFGIGSVTDLKIKLLETVAILLAVLFLKQALDFSDDEAIEWSNLVTPISVLIFAAAIWLMRRAH